MSIAVDEVESANPTGASANIPLIARAAFVTMAGITTLRGCGLVEEGNLNGESKKRRGGERNKRFHVNDLIHYCLN